MLGMLLDAIYGEVISASIPGMKTQGAAGSALSSSVDSAAWLPELIEALDNADRLPAPNQSDIDACYTQLLRPSTAHQTLN
ncbi:hypothetical protein [Bradyrhizobium guangdongense]|nr:hypothetical protein [Bradyrhizobium guangdongense]